MSDDTKAIVERLTERDRDVLEELCSACESDLEWHAKGYRTGRSPGWARPLDCGGSNSSDHSYRLSKLTKLGLAECKQRRGAAGRRGSKVYRPTELGLLVRDALNGGGE